uniref:SH2 domain-containing protein n=1 Tax=Acrobeloides nanus TaxID=290746 RepID=A0A914E033_9BILA
MMEICSSTDNQLNNLNKLFEEIDNVIRFIFIETQRLEACVKGCFDQIQQIGHHLVQSPHIFDESQYNQICLHLESYKNQFIAINDELKNNILMKWKIRQQEFSVGCINENDVYNQKLSESLKSIDGSIFQFASALNRIYSSAYFVLTSLGGYRTNIATNNPENSNMAIDIFNNTHVAIEAYRNFFMELTRDLCISSIIIYKQPPAIITMFEQRAPSTKSKDKPNKNDGELKKSIRPRSRFWFDTEICLLGAQFWAQNYGITLSDITCEVLLLTESKVEEQKFTIQPNKVDFDPVKSTASFIDMRIVKAEKRPHGVKKRRYAILYEMQASFFGRIRKLSLPFAITSGEPDIKTDTLLFMERSFANLSAQIGKEEARMIQGQTLTFDEYYNSLDLKLMSIDNDRVINGLELKFRAKKHLAHMLEQPIPKHLAEKGRECKCRQCQLKKDGHAVVFGKIFLSSIMDHIVCMKFVPHEGKLALEDSTFNEWFYKVAEIAGILKNYWNSGEILGFCDQQLAELLLVDKPDRILIRFADTMLGQLRLSIRDGKNVQTKSTAYGESVLPRVRHVTIKYAETPNSIEHDSFNDEKQFSKLITTVAKKYNIYYIYPEFKIDPMSLLEEKTSDVDETEYNKNTYSLAKRLGNLLIDERFDVGGPHSA